MRRPEAVFERMGGWAANPRRTMARALNRIAGKLSPGVPVHSPTRAETEGEAHRSMERVLLEGLYDDAIGAAYGIGRRTKEDWVDRFRRNTTELPSGTYWLAHAVLAREILKIPPEVAGDVVECGCYKGASTASLSIVCKAVGRKLLVCDSFEGLPSEVEMRVHHYPHIQVYGYYQAGMYAGNLEEVRSNIARYGELEACRFVPGFYAESLRELRDPIVFAFLDVDLLTSTQECLKAIWPLLREGGLIYTDDSCDVEVVRIWFDGPWWQQELGEPAPGYVGSGCGLYSPTLVSLGYARRVTRPEESYGRVPWLRYPEGGLAGARLPVESIGCDS
jgi:O-methyltransferase